MICEELSTVLGFDCSPLRADGRLALVSTPFRFEDGDALPVFVEVSGSQIRFFDDGQVLMHFIGRGVRIEDGRQTRFLKNATTACGASFTEAGEVEVWTPLASASAGFAKYIESLFALVSWERDQQGASTDTALFVEEVGMALRAAFPHSELRDEPRFTGVSGREYSLDFLLDDIGVIATNPHPNAVSSVVHKLLDIHGRPANVGLNFLVVIDDRTDSEAAESESRIVQSVARVQQFTRLPDLQLRRPH